MIIILKIKIDYLVKIITGVDAQVHVFQESLRCDNAIWIATNFIVFDIPKVNWG